MLNDPIKVLFCPERNLTISFCALREMLDSHKKVVIYRGFSTGSGFTLSNGKSNCYCTHSISSIG